MNILDRAFADSIYFAMFHHAQLSQPITVEGVTGGMDNMTQLVLLRQRYH